MDCGMDFPQLHWLASLAPLAVKMVRLLLVAISRQLSSEILFTNHSLCVGRVIF